MLVLDLFLSTMSPFGEVVRNAGLLDEIFRVQKRCARVMLDAPFQAKDPAITRITINQICIERRLLLFKKILDGRAPDTRSRLPYRLPRTNCMKRMFFYNAVKLWKNVSVTLELPTLIAGDLLMGQSGQFVDLGHYK